jgi:hypothetical protein
VRLYHDLAQKFVDHGPVITFAFACICIQVWPTEMTIWALVIALLICKFCLDRIDKRLQVPLSCFILALVYVVPIGMIQAVTNRQVGLKWVSTIVVKAGGILLKRFACNSVVTELIVGYMLPGVSLSLCLSRPIWLKDGRKT